MLPKQSIIEIMEISMMIAKTVGNISSRYRVEVYCIFFCNIKNIELGCYKLSFKAGFVAE